MLNKINLKKASIGETMTWVVATAIVVVVLLASVFITSLLAKTKSVDRNFLSGGGEDLVVTKSLSAYLLTEENGENVFEQLMDNKDSEDIGGIFGEFNGNLAEDIFLKLYVEDYSASKIWLGTYLKGYGHRGNSYFRTSPVDFILESGILLIEVKKGQTFVVNQIELDEKNWFVVALTN